MGRRLIEVMQVLVDQVHKGGYQHRVLEDDIYTETQKRIAAEKDRDHWKQARQEAHEAGELMKAEIETLRTEVETLQKRRSAVQVILDRIGQLSDVHAGDHDACVDAIGQIRKYFNGNEYPFLKGGE